MNISTGSEKIRLAQYPVATTDQKKTSTEE